MPDENIASRVPYGTFTFSNSLRWAMGVQMPDNWWENEGPEAWDRMYKECLAMSQRLEERLSREKNTKTN